MSLFKDSYQCLKEFSDFGLQQEISYEFSVDCLFVVKNSYQCLIFVILDHNRKSPMNSELIASLC